MSKASKVINIFIFVFAIVVVVFGVLLFQKREQITQARTDIATTVEKVSRLIDSSATIQSDDLKISKTPAEVREAMVKLESAVNKIVKQRDAIAENLTDVTNTVLEKAYYGEGDEPYILEVGSVTGYRSTDATLAEIKTHIGDRMQYFYDRDAYLSDFMTKDGVNLGMSSRSYAFSADTKKFKNALDELLNKTNDTVDRMKAFRGHIVTVSNQLNPDAPEIDLDTQEYNQLLQKNMTAVEDHVKEYQETKKQNEELRERIRRAEGHLSEVEGQTSEYKEIAEKAQAEVAELRKEVDRLHAIIDPNNSNNAKIIDFTVLKDLVGKVVSVNEEYGYITVDIGTESEVVRSSGEHLRASVPDGALLTVATSLDPETAKYVCKAKVIRLRAKAAVATILASPGGSFAYPSVGDVVYFSLGDITKMQAAHMEAIRKKELEEREAERAKTEEDFSNIGDDQADDTGIDFGDDLLGDDDDGDAFDMSGNGDDDGFDDFD